MSAAPTPIHTGRKLGIATGANRHSNRVKNEKVTWTAFVERLREPVRTNETQAEYSGMQKEAQDGIKDVGYVIGGTFRGHRRKKLEVQGRDILSLDCDHAPLAAVERIKDALLGCAYVIHSTHKHRASKPRYRIFLPTTRTIQPDEYAPIARKIAEKIDIEFFDATTDEVSRCMFWPSVSSDGDYVFETNDGDWLDPDAVLDEYGDWRDATEWPESSRHQKTRVPSGKKAVDPRTKGGLVGAFCRVYGIDSAIAEYIPDCYQSSTAGRYTYAHSTTANGAVTYENTWLYSHHESDPCSRQLVNAYDLVRIHKFGNLDEDSHAQTSVSKLPSSVEMRKLVEADGEVRAELVGEAIEGFEEAGSRSWFAELDTTKDGRIKPSIGNLDLILANDSDLQGLYFNQLRGAVVKREGLPWASCSDKRNGDQWTDADDLQLRLFIEKRYKTEVTKDRAFDAANIAALNNQFHPIRDYLEGVEWDGTPRLDTMLSRHLCVEETPYTTAVSRKIMCAAVARVFQPGCKFDHCLILEGSQGKGKSTFLKILAVDPDWFGDDIPNLSGKEVIEAIAGRWFIELSELQAFSKSEIEHIKAFMSRTEDRARLAYGRRTQSFPRQTVFVGTTNDREYLKDDTGNRRFWPVLCTIPKVDFEALKAERDQLWAEAVFLWRQGEPLFLEDDRVETIAKEEQAARRVDDGLAGTIAEWLDTPPDDFLPEESREVLQRICAKQIWIECLGGRETDYNRAKADQISRAMHRIEGWTKSEGSVRFKGYGKQTGWFRNAD